MLHGLHVLFKLSGELLIVHPLSGDESSFLFFALLFLLEDGLNDVLLYSFVVGLLIILNLGISLLGRRHPLLGVSLPFLGC